MPVSLLPLVPPAPCPSGAFNMTTGPAHWQLLQQARAVDNQLFVATCSPARGEGPGYIAWGHSTAVGPFAEILGTTGVRDARCGRPVLFAATASTAAHGCTCRMLLLMLLCWLAGREALVAGHMECVTGSLAQPDISSPLCCADEKPGIVYAEMDFAQLAERRANMPLRQQKRTDLYSLLDLTR